MEVTIKEVSPLSPDAISLTLELFNELEEIYGKENIEDFTGENEEFIYFILAYKDDKTIACGALKHFAGDTGEIKRMYVRKEFRGKGISKLILSDLEKRAIEKSYKRIVLETGLKQPEAIGLYEKNDYKRIDCYGRYADNTESICFQKNLWV